MVCGFMWEELLGEGVFYGLKIEYYIKDVFGCLWQCGMFQFDMVLLECLGVEYVVEDNSCCWLVMLYCVIVGLMECFFGILIEYYVGVMLVWFVLYQVIVFNIVESQVEYVQFLV